MIHTEMQFLETLDEINKLRLSIRRFNTEVSFSSHPSLIQDSFEDYQEDKILLCKLLNDINQYQLKCDWDRQGRWTIIAGRRFWPEDPRPGDVDVKVIAHALARTNRFNGHTTTSYSVAQHAVMVSHNVPKQYAMFALHHDSSEAYLGDVTSPLKRLIRDVYEPIEHRLMRAIANRYLFLEQYESKRANVVVKTADIEALLTEARDLTLSGFVWFAQDEWDGLAGTPMPYEAKIEGCWGPDRAEKEFLLRHEELWQDNIRSRAHTNRSTPKTPG